MSERILTRTLEGAIWSALGRLVQTGMSIASVVVIAQVLTPEVYGLFGAAMLLIGLSEIITGGALTQCLIQRAALDQAHIDSTFWLNTALSIVAAAGLAGFAGPLLSILNAPGATAALYCLAALTILNGIAATPQALLMRNMAFRRSMHIDTASITLASATGIGLALAGAGIWALILMESVRVVVRTALLVFWTNWRVAGRGSRQALRELTAFNLSSLGTVSLARIEMLLPRTLVAMLLGPQALGIWLLARRIVDEIQRLSAVPLTAVTMTAVARLQHESARVRQVVSGLYQASSLFALPMHAGAIAILPWLLPVAFGSQWTAAVLPCQILLISGLRTCHGVFDVSILRGLGHVGLPLVSMSLAIVALALLIPALAGYGVAGVATAVALRYALIWPLGNAFVRRATGMPIAQQLRPMLVPLASALIMAGLVYAAMPWAVTGFGVHLALVFGVTLGALAYAASVFLLSPTLGRRLMDLLVALRRRDRDGIGRLLGDVT